MNAFHFDNGYSNEENVSQSQTVWVEDNIGNLLGCGILKDEVKERVRVADMPRTNPNPSSSDKFAPEGKVSVTFYSDETLKFQSDVSGSEANCEGCGIHIHSGTSSVCEILQMLASLEFSLEGFMLKAA